MNSCDIDWSHGFNNYFVQEVTSRGEIESWKTSLSCLLILLSLSLFFFEFLASQEAGDGDREWPLNYMAFLRLSWFPRDVIFLNHPFDFLSLSPSWQTSFPSGQILYCLRQEWSGGCFFDLFFSFYWNNIRNRALLQRLLHYADKERQSVSLWCNTFSSSWLCLYTPLVFSTLDSDQEMKMQRRGNISLLDLLPLSPPHSPSTACIP